MQTKISKTLEGIFARTAFDTAKAGIVRSLKDYLMLEILRTEGSQACEMVSSSVDRDDKDLIISSIEQRLKELPFLPVSVSPEEFFSRYVRELTERYDGTPTVTSVDLLFDILDDRDTVSSKVFTESQKALLHLERERRESAMLRAVIHAGSPAAAEPSVLEKFGTDLTRSAREGKIDPVVGREREIERVVRILSRRKLNNPLLVGEAGVGKSAIVEGLALRIAAGRVPATIRNKRLFSLDIASIVAGTKFRGEFEERMQQILEELRRSGDTILFIDEIHTIAGAGSTQGSLDAADILKPALARGEVQIVGATTPGEYRVYIERDAALERRFRRVTVEPATRDETLAILRGIAPGYEHHHGVRYDEEALRACVDLTERYITDRCLPDKAIDVMDEAGSAAREAGETTVDARCIASAITSMTGIPAERIAGGELERIRTLHKRLSARIIGQDEAVEAVAKAVRRSRSGLKDERRPAGVFLFVGPTGVGKTLLAKELSRLLFDDERGLIRLDMSEYGERHNVSRLIGSPPGYVGYGEGGQLTEAVRRRPYSVVLFDEIEKAHPEVFNTMLQIFDEGCLTDGEGRRVDFRNTIIIMTSNAGSRSASASKPARPGYITPTKEASVTASAEDDYRKAVEATFAPEFVNRIDDIVIFRTLTPANVGRIVDIELQATIDRAAKLGYEVRVTAAAKRLIADKGYESRYGVRALRRTITNEVEEPLAALIVGGELRDGAKVVIEKSKLGGVALRVA